MLADSKALATLPAKDMDRARAFYEDTLGLKRMGEQAGGTAFECADGTGVLVFPSSGQASGNHTQLAFMCEDVMTEIDTLRSRGVTFEEFDMPDVEWDNGVATMDGFRGAWFRDPEGNLLSVGEVSKLG